MSFPIERADPSQVEALCAIERKAVQLFRGHPAWPSYAAVSIPPELLRQAIGRGLVWVALDGTGGPVGFVWLDTDLAGGAIGIAEIDVLPEAVRVFVKTVDSESDFVAEWLIEVTGETFVAE